MTRLFFGSLTLAFLGAWYSYDAFAIPLDPPSLTRLTKDDLKDAKQQFKAAQRDFNTLKQDFKAGELTRNEFRAARENFLTEKQYFRGIRNELRAVNATAAPIPGTFLLFGAGFASLVAWQRYSSRRSK